MKRKEKKSSVLVVGIGAFAFGRAKRAVRMLKQMEMIKSYFFISKYEDGSVSKLIERNRFEYEHVPFGYIGRSKPIWTAITMIQLPILYYQFFATYFKRNFNSILILSIHPLLNAFIPIFILRFLFKTDLIIYFGDIPANNSIHRLLSRLINRTTNKIIVNSKAVKQGMIAIGIKKENIRVIYNGVNLKKFKEASPIKFHQKFNWPSNSILIGYIGQFTENKGAWDFILAAETLLKYNKNCRFLLIGKAEKREPFYQKLLYHISHGQLSNYIKFTGWIERMERAYAALDIVVVPSRHEDPAPNVTIEAMASGTAIIATRVGGTPELVLDGVTGYLVEKEHPEQIAQYLLELANNKSLRKKMGEKGRERVYKFFDIHKNAKLVEEIILS